MYLDREDGHRDCSTRPDLAAPRPRRSKPKRRSIRTSCAAGGARPELADRGAGIAGGLPGRHRPPGQSAPGRSQAAARAGSAAASSRCSASRSRALAVGGGWYGYHWWTVGRFMVSTDDAYVRADNTTLAAKVSGYVASVFVADNTLRARRRRDRRASTTATIGWRSTSARDKVATQQATVDRIGRQIVAQQAAVDQAQGAARLGAGRRRRAPSSSSTASRRSRRKRIRQPAGARAGARQPRPGASPRCKSAQAAVEAAHANVDVLKAQQQEAARTLDELKTALAKAERDLVLHHHPRADRRRDRQPRHAGRRLRAARPAARQPGAARRGLCRRQLQGDAARAACEPGQPVTIAVDALPGRDDRRHGRRASRRPPARCSRCCRPTTRPATSPRSCSACRCASACRPTSPTSGVLRPGMSVVVSVDTKPERGRRPCRCARQRRHDSAARRLAMSATLAITPCRRRCRPPSARGGRRGRASIRAG